jgi:hypothetical protein
MDAMTIERMAENYALATYLTEFDDSSYDEIMEAFAENVIPDDVIIWLPFESFELDELREFIEITRNDFLTFADNVRGIK